VDVEGIVGVLHGVVPSTYASRPLLPPIW
jgi:hypothetical protein